MSADAWITLLVVLATTTALVRDLVPPAMAVLGATVLLLVAGVIDTQQAFAGFSNPAPITVAALFVLARAVEVSGALEPVVNRVMGAGRAESERAATRGVASFWARRRTLARLTVPTALASGVLNNTPIVAMAAPQVADWADRRGLSAAPLLMPLSFAAMLGGLLTAIGTSTNLVVSGLLQDAGMAPLGMFEIGRVGLPVAAGGLIVMLLFAHRLLPERRGALRTFGQSAREFTVSMRVQDAGALDGRTVAGAGLRDLQGVYLVEIERGERVIAPVGPDEVLAGGDVLTFAGKVDLVVDLQRKRGLESTEARHLDAFDGTGHTFFEVVTGHDSPLLGRTLKEAGFRGRYQAAVVAIHRAGERIDAKLGEVPLRVGDTLLVLADEHFTDRWHDSRDFLLVSRLGGTPPHRTRKAPIVALVVGLLLLVAGTGLMPILEASLVAAGLLVLVGALSPREARDAVDIDVVVLIAAAFGVGAAVQASGLADALAGGLVDGLAGWGAVGALVAILIATTLLTELITNNAAAVLMFPVAISTAAAVGAQPRPFAIAVAVAASASMLTPIGYQTNTMVYGLGGYRFGDFPRLGVPVNLVVIAIATLVIPLAWPL